MQYIKYQFAPIGEYSPEDIETFTDLLSTDLAEAGFDSFELSDGVLSAYVPAESLSEEALAQALAFFPIEDLHWQYSAELLPDINWNEEWEKNYFQPILLDGGQCLIRAPFHSPQPEVPIEIIISPKMAFGTGNHATTSLIANWLIGHAPANLSVLDMGCGTGILGLLALKLGAKRLTAIDIDEWAYRNVQENASLNSLSVDEMLCGDASLLGGHAPFDLVLANITRNVLMEDMPAYVAVMHSGARLVLSGFYTEDVPLLRDRAEALGLRFVSTHSSNNWAIVIVEK